MTWEMFDKWMKMMKAAWENRDPNAAANLCSDEGFEYYENIFEKPLTTKDEVVKVWREVPIDQDDVRFNYDILLTSPDEGYAHWRASYKSKSADKVVTLDGIFIVKLDSKGLCKQFKMWWIKK